MVLYISSWLSPMGKRRTVNLVKVCWLKPNCKIVQLRFSNLKGLLTNVFFFIFARHSSNFNNRSLTLHTSFHRDNISFNRDNKLRHGQSMLLDVSTNNLVDTLSMITIQGKAGIPVGFPYNFISSARLNIFLHLYS